MTKSGPPGYTQVTPEMAKEWLEKYNNANRNLRELTVEAMAYDMLGNMWTQCHVPIEFYEDGQLADGQHRLAAVALSDVPQWFRIVRGVPRAHGINKDTGTPRTLRDNARISGLDTELTNELVSWSRSIEFGMISSGKRPLTNSEKLAVLAKHREAVDWLAEYGPRGKGLRNAPVCGAIGRAWYHEPNREKLKRFCEVLSKVGLSEGPQESAAVSLNGYLREHKDLLTATKWEDTFRKTQNACWYFMRGRKLTIIKKVSEEMYPLTGPKGSK